MNKSLIMPRAIMGRVRAEADPAKLFGELRESVSGFMDQHNTRLANMENALNSVLDARAPAITANIGPAPDQEYSRTFASYFRKGDGEQELRAANAIGQRAAIQAAMSAGDNSSGGYLAPVEWDRKISEAQRATSPLRRLATVVQSSVGAYTTLWNSDEHGSGWVGEVAARPATTGSTFASINFAAGEIYANQAVSQRLLDDSAINVEQWLINSLQREFSRQEAVAFISGDGSNKPAGFLTFAEGGVNAASHPGGPIDVTETVITVDALVDFSYGLAAPYRQNATWLMSSLTAAALTKLKDADGNLIWRESLIVGQPATLLGRPVAIDEGMPAPTAGQMPIAFGDFAAGYVINDRLGVKTLRDPYSNKPFVMFYTVKRVGGGLLNPGAIRVLKVPA
jgi:HK97 family phage major capsid protein